MNNKLQSESWLKYIRGFCNDKHVELVFGNRACADVENRIIYCPYPDESNAEQMNMTKGFIKHELGHILYSDDFGKITDKKSKELFNTANAFEDVRIERKLAKDCKGIEIDFRELYDSQMPKIIEGMKEHQEKINPQIAFNIAMNEYLRTGKTECGKLIADSKTRELFFKNRLDIEERFNHCKNTADIIDLARHVNALVNYVEPQGDAQGDGQKSPDGQPQNAQDGQQGANQGKDQGEQENAQDSPESSQGSPEQGNEPGQPQGSQNDAQGKEEGKEEGKELTGEQVNQLMKDLNDTAKNLSKQLLRLADKMIHNEPYIFDGKINRKSSKNIRIQNKIGRKISRPEKNPVMINQLKRALQDILIDQARNRTLSNQTRGKLHARNLHRIISQKQSPRVFKKNINGIENNIDLAILIDSSGSMIQDAKRLPDGNWLDRFDLAMNFSVNLYESLKDIRQINYSMTGYTTDESKDHKNGAVIVNPVELFTFKSFGSKTFDMTLATEMLTNKRLYLHWNNDYESIKDAREQLRRQPNARKIIFVISDGMPNIRCIDPCKLQELTKGLVNECRAEGVEVYCFFIGHDIDRATDIYGAENFMELNPNDLADGIGRKLRALIK